MTPPTVAALFVDPKGVYAGLEGVEVWDEARDARLYPGPWPVVAHPPCGRWCQLASVNQARWGAKIGDDGGCFAAALQAVRRWGGVLEHPAYSLAWGTFDLPIPTRYGWVQQLFDGGATTELSQVAYGHPARKLTWLYAVGIDFTVPLRYQDGTGSHVVGAGINSGQAAGRPRIDGVAASATPPTLATALVALARTATQLDTASIP